jgi:uncharacterized membrane protein
MANETDPAALFRRIKFLHGLFMALFFASIVILLMQQTRYGVTTLTTLAWAATLVAALAVRLYRRALIKQFKAVAPSAPPPRPRSKRR